MIYGSSDDQANAVQGPAGAGFFKGPITFWARKQILQAFGMVAHAHSSLLTNQSVKLR